MANDSGLDQSFQAALRAAADKPDSGDAWDHLEDLADKLGRPDDVARVYGDVLDSNLSKIVFDQIAERAVQFHEEWFGDTPDRITSLMTRIIELDPEAEWAFERLTVILTSAEQWDLLLGVYDRTLGRTQDRERRRRLLNDAAQVAKDFADEADRAADYMQQLLLIEPSNTQLVTSLERLLEKQERWRDLVDLWMGTIPNLRPEQIRATRIRVATCWLDRLDQPDRALEQMRSLLSDSPGNIEACEVLERILERDTTEGGTRRTALSLLRKAYVVAERPEDVVRVLGRAIEFVDADEQRPLHREMGTRLAILGRDEDAMQHYGALLTRDPTDPDARKQIRTLAKRSGRHDLHASALIAAAEACPDETQSVAVLLEAANLQRSVLGDAEAAIQVFSRVLNSPEAEELIALAAAHSLTELLAAAERHDERLAVLEKLAGLERSSAVRRIVLGEAARLADKLGDPDRALANWQPVLEADPHDLEALTAVVDILHSNERWEELISALAQRAGAPVLPQQRRADLVLIAQVQADRLNQIDGAIDTWLAVREEFGENGEVVEKLDDLMSRASRYPELAELLEGAARQERARAGRLLTRLGDVYREKLGEHERPLEWYERALGVSPIDTGARAGAEALLEVEGCRARAAETLARAFEITDDWQHLLNLLEHRIDAADSPRKRGDLLREAAGLLLDRAGDPDAALAALGRALPFEPDNLALEAELLRVAALTERWAYVARAFAEAGSEVAESAPRRAAELHRRAAEIHELRVGDPNSALASYQAAVEADGSDLDALEGVARTGAAAGDWSAATSAAVKSASLRDRLRPELIGWLESGATSVEAWTTLSQHGEHAVQQHALRPELAQALEMTLAVWLRDHVGDAEAAEQAAIRAVAQGPGKLEALQLLAGLQRSHPDPALIATLLRIDDVEEHSLDALHEAAQLALESPDDVVQTQSILEQLYRKAGGMWVRNEPAAGDKMPADLAVWALDKVIAYHVFAGNSERAVQILLDGARLPLDAERSCTMRRRAAEMMAEAGERSRAIEVYRGVLEGLPEDVEVLRRVATLCEDDGRVSEALALRLKELDLIEDPERRLELRLDHSRLTGKLEEQGGRVVSLRANLRQAPGHKKTVDELESVLTERGKFEELSQVLSEQATQLEQLSRAEDAADLWARVAVLAERRLQQPDLAISAHTRVVELAPTNESLDALARLNLERKEPAEAAQWLERRLATTGENERVAVLLKLARARIRADHRDAAVTALQTAFGEAPRNAEVRKLLLRLYRDAKEWDALADTLTVAAQHVSDEDTILAYAREAADIYHNRLKAPERSVPVLRKAVTITEDDRALRRMLATGLRMAGELDDGKALLEGLIADFGRRRSPERAAIHLELAHVHHAQGATQEAIEQLDRASKMDASNVTILNTLASLAQEAEQLDRAERAYRTLLITVRRADDARTLPIGPSEVLLELSHIAASRDQQDKATELVESALESLSSHDYEAERIQAKLRERNQPELLLRVLDKRLGYVDGAHTRAAVLSDRAAVLHGSLDRSSEALDARLEAIKTDPSSPLHHQAAWDLASELGAMERYVTDVEALLSDERADKSAHVRCELLLRLGEVLERERQDYARAAELYAQAETTRVRQVDVWRAMARAAGARGDEAEQVRILGMLANLGEDQAETRSDALYRLAEVQLAAAPTVDDGLAVMQRALDTDFKAERAAMILRRACDEHAHVALLDTYERVARRSGDEATLLHYLDRRSAHPDATTDQTREAVDVAIRLGDDAAAERLMLRAAEIGQRSDMTQIGWALLGLAERRKIAGDMAGAVKWLGEAAEVAEPAKVFEAALEIGELASAPGGDLTLAAKLYERLLERDPTARQAWQPLAKIYAQLGDVSRLERMVEETLDGLQAPGDRNALRVELARALLNDDARSNDAVEVLHQVLLDEPEQPTAQGLLVDYFEKSGNIEQLIDLLRNQLAAAEAREDAAAVKAAGLRLGKRLEADNVGAAIDVYRGALRWAPEDEELLTVTLGLMGDDTDPHDRAQLTERLITVESSATGGPRAIELVGIYEALGDSDGALRALKLGYERAPENEELRQRLEQRYRERGDYQGLAQTLLDAAEHRDEADAKVLLLREAALVYRDHLAHPAGAAHLLGQACELAPDDLNLRIELAYALSQGGEDERAVTTLTAAVDGSDDNATRLELLLARAHVYGAAGDDDAMLADLEGAYEIDAPRVAPALEQAHDHCRRIAAQNGEVERERLHTLRCVDMALVQDKREFASGLLATWIERAPDDVEALRRVRDIDTADERWDRVAATCERLVVIETGSNQIDAALSLTHAYHALERPEDAKPGLEAVLQHQPDNMQVRAELRNIYEALGDQHRLAALLVEDAKVLEDPEQRRDLLLRAGQLFVEMGDAVSAVPALRAALEVDDEHGDTIASLADAYILAGWFDDANELLDRVITAGRGRRTPEIATYFHRKAQVAEAQGDRSKHLNFLQEAHQCNKKNGHVACELANLAEQLEEYDVAAKTLRTITLIDGECPISRPEAFFRQARIAHLQGDEKSAKMWARRARREDPDSPQIEEFLRELGEKVSIPPARR